MARKLNHKYLMAVESFVLAYVENPEIVTTGSTELKNLVDGVSAIYSEYMTPGQAQYFLMSELQEYFHERGEWLATSTRAKIEQHKSRIIERLVSAIASLPREYKLSIELPAAADLGEFSERISSSLKLVGKDNDISEWLFEPARSWHEARHLNKSSTWLEIRVKGYANKSPDSPAMAEAFSVAKQWAFLASASGIFVRATWRDQKRLPKAYLSGDKYLEPIAVQLVDPLSTCFSDLGPSNDLRVSHDSQTFGGGLFGVITEKDSKIATTSRERVDAIADSMRAFGRFFDCTDNESYGSLAAAMEWHEDSLYTENQTFAYLAACIGLEALLGSDGQMEAMSKRLADRYGFMMGHSRAERIRLTEQYEAVLSLRGKLVHARRARLSRDDQATLSTVQNMLSEVIWQELRQMLQDI